MANEITTPVRERSLVAAMAETYGMGTREFYETLTKTVMPNPNASKEQVAAFLMVAHKHSLNPFTREIFAFPGKGGGVQAIVSIDGWMTMANRKPNFDGITFVDRIENGKLFSVTAQVHRKDREHPIEVTEYMSECARNTETWKQWPARMLRHKAAIQAIRYAFGFSGIMEPDEAERMERPARTSGADLTQAIAEAEVVEVVDATQDVPPHADTVPAWANQLEELVLTSPTGNAFDLED
jgi:phage recombination protein Bet